MNNIRNRIKYLAGIIQKAGYVNKECQVKILLHCLFPKLMYGICCTFGVKSILNPLNKAFNNGFKNFNIARHTRVRLIIYDFNVLPESLIVVCNLFDAIQNVLKIDQFQQLIAHLFLKSDCYYDLKEPYMIFIYICVKLKLSKSYNNCKNVFISFLCMICRFYILDE